MWFKRAGKEPRRCPNQGCRKLGSYGDEQRGSEGGIGSDLPTRSGRDNVRVGEFKAAAGSHESAREDVVVGGVSAKGSEVGSKAVAVDAGHSEGFIRYSHAIPDETGIPEEIPAERKSGLKRLTAEQFSALAPSEQLRAMREGKW